MDFDYLFKVLLVGKAGVGKSSIVRRYCHDQFMVSSGNTIGVDFEIKNISIDDKKIRLQIWDTAGEERFAHIIKSYFRATQSVILVFSLEDNSSLDYLERFYETMQERCPHAMCTLVGNKIDLTSDISSKITERYAKDHGFEYIETSAKTSENINELFVAIATSLLKHQLPPPPEGLQLDKPVSLRDRFRKFCQS